MTAGSQRIPIKVLLGIGFGMFLLPLLIGTGAVMDAGGRAATLAAGAISLTFAFGPACGGFIATWFSYAAIGWFSCALCLLAALAFILVEPADFSYSS